MDTVHDSQAFISHHLSMLERPTTPGKDAHMPWGRGRVHMYPDALGSANLLLNEQV